MLDQKQQFVIYPFIQILLIVILVFSKNPASALTQAELRPRLIVETDLGGDADDQASLVRLLMFCDQFDIEAILLDRSDDRFQDDGAAVNPSNSTNALDMGRDYLNAWAQIRPNLIIHSSLYPTYQELYNVMVHAHNNTTAGRDLIIQIVDADDPRPVWYGNWGSNSGTTSNLRRALDWVKANRAQAEYEIFASRIRIASLDGSGRTRQRHEDVIKLHIETGFPNMDGGRWYHRFMPITSTAGGFDQYRDIRNNHGTLGGLYPGQKEGDSWCFVHLLSQATGVSIPTRVTWGGFAGRYAGLRSGSDYPNNSFWWNQVRDSWNGKNNRDQTAARYADDMQHHFAVRMDWGQTSSYSGANHPPQVVVNNDSSAGVIRLFAEPGHQIALRATGSSDPDGDAISYRWIRYDEADSYSGSVNMNSAESEVTNVTIPDDAHGKDIHIYLEAQDNGDATPANNNPSLKAYRRIVLSVRNQLKIMCLGDSITDGSHHSDNNDGAYRKELWKRIVAKGLNVDFVGSKQNGPPEIDQDHEGFIGYRIDELYGDADGSEPDVNLAQKLRVYQPDVILLLIGTNDALQDTDIANVDHRYMKLLQMIYDENPDTLVLFGNLPPAENITVNDRINQINAQLANVKVAAYHIGLWAEMLDLNSLITLSDLPDGVHPGPGGDEKIGRAFFYALERVLLQQASRTDMETPWRLRIVQ